MAIRVRANGQMLCAALHPPEPGDTYIDDTLHHEMFSVHGVITTDPEPKHSEHGEWWWRPGGGVARGAEKREDDWPMDVIGRTEKR